MLSHTLSRISPCESVSASAMLRSSHVPQKARMWEQRQRVRQRHKEVNREVAQHAASQV